MAFKDVLAVNLNMRKLLYLSLHQVDNIVSFVDDSISGTMLLITTLGRSKLR